MPDRKLPRERRLRKKPEIDRVFQRGRSSKDGLLRVHARRRRSGDSRIAVSCPRRIGSSVSRSRWKRLIREAFRLNREQIGPGLDIVAVPLRGPTDVKCGQVERSLMAALRKIRSRGA